MPYSSAPLTMAPYVCRGCGTEVSYPGTFKKCPVCGIKWG